MRRSTRVLAGSLVAGILTVAMVIGIPGISPEQQASALCISSIDAKCAGANLPILIDAGIVTADLAPSPGTVDSPKPVTGVVKPKGSKYGLLAELVIGAVGAVSGFLDMFSTDDAGVQSKGGLSPEGLVGQSLSTDARLAALDSTGTAIQPACQPLRQPSDPAYNQLAARQKIDGFWFYPKNCDYTTTNIGGPVTMTEAYGSEIVDGQLVITRTLAASHAGSSSTLVQASNTLAQIICSRPGDLASQNGLGTATDVVRALSGDRVHNTKFKASCAAGYQLDSIASGVGTTSTRVYYSFKGLTMLPDKKSMSGTLRTTLRCSDATSTITHTVNTAYEMVIDGRAVMPDVTCPPGRVATGGGVGFTPKGTTTETEIIPHREEAITPAQKEFIQAKPECFTAGQAACLLVLYVIGQNGGLQSCGTTAELCPDWAKDPQATKNYKCQWGGSDVDLRYCSAYRLPALGILPNVKADGSPEDITAPAPGNLQKPKPEGKPAAGTEPTPEQVARACQDKNPSWFESLNPFWIVESVGCALRQAFTPRAEQIKATTARINAAFTRSGFGSVATMLTALEHGVPVAGGCSGIPWEFKVRTLEVDASILNSCPGEPLAEVAGVIRGILVPLLWTGALLLWVRYIAGIIGYVPFGSTVNTNPGTGTSVHDIGTMTQIRPAIGGGSSQKAIGQ